MPAWSVDVPLLQRSSLFLRRISVPLSMASALLVTVPAMAGDATLVHPEQWPKGTSPLPPDPAIESRIRALLAKMSVEDKVGQMIQADIKYVTPDDVRKYRLGSVLAGGNSKPPGQPYPVASQWQALSDAFYRASMDTSHGGLAIPVLFGIDAVHGHNNLVGSTLFPQNVGLGATRDPQLIHDIGEVTAQELRASGISWTFAPTLTVPQDGRWGRSYEGYSQNPALVAQYAAAVVGGLEGKPGTPQFLDAGHVIATAKHFLGDGGTHDGKDQGDAQISEATLRDIHGAGYPPAIKAGVQVVMVSFSSWNGVKMAGNKALITGVLKERMGFDGIVLGDWNAHGQVPGCSNEDCAAAYNAGLDMLEAPDSWKGVYTNTLAEVKAGVIPMSRVDDAVTRILRVKMRLGMFEAGLPSTNPIAAKATDVVGSPSHRAVARRAVRESLVLLKNNGDVLPIDPRKHVLVAGNGADNISKQNGGWTLTWQGTGLTNANFPGATSVWAGLRAQVEAAGGSAELSVEGDAKQKPDVAIVVFGEDPYAEFQGDLPNLAYRPGNDHDLDLIRKLRGQGVPVVAVFLTGRPLWMNREINAADAFVVAWLPGSEGEGIADVLLRTRDGRIANDFHGKLAYAWPRSALQVPVAAVARGEHPQFPYGFGLTYADKTKTGTLPEDPGLVLSSAQAGVYFTRGKPAQDFVVRLTGANGVAMNVTATPAATADGSLHVGALDYKAQEDARSLSWSGAGAHAASVELVAPAPLDVDRETNGDVMLVTTLKVDAVSPGDTSTIGIGCGAGCSGWVPVGSQLSALPKGQWLSVGIPLKCFRDAGANMSKVDRPFAWSSHSGGQIAITDVSLSTVADRTLVCPAHADKP
ncbi:1,4-beta-D-glucan glucohydrolase [Luteibacter rhizovicinus DSM 16549]|uniref:1,4-beta-D-glucan glucohydrolase n=2 Tax=Luteibacter rhizovicinus TaxID=242606 RepID=A0A0G9HAZ2_9GAMM|nr:1,4-beta-D-glucan glucohydrolase [Luteibacter rhizovicinus DSM 16549]KLD66985.1 1,4-beta-D-glucan glucohydrolase [Luteibacter rhizovicinus DSM 16549]